MRNSFFHFNSIKENRSWYAVALVALLMPFYHNWSELTIVFLFIVLLSDADVWKRLTTFTKKSLLYPMILLFMMYAIGLLYTTNISDGWSVLQTELPLLLFPVFLSALDYSKREQMDFVILSFLVGCLLAGLICIGVATFTWFTMRANHFFYNDLSLFMHPGYFALYLNFAMCCLYQKIIFEDGIKYLKKPLIILILFFINALVLMLSSKAGIFTACLIQITLLIASLIRKKNSRKAIGIISGMALFWILFYSVILPKDQERIINSGEAVIGKPIPNTATESSSVRLLIWKSALPLVKKTFWFGTGTGNVQAKLMDVYKANGITVAFEKELNAHNQFLQTILAIGLPGLILLLLSLALPFLKGIRDKNYLLYMFSFIMAFNFLFESILERQVGVVFFALFLTLLIMSNSHKTVT